MIDRGVCSRWLGVALVAGVSAVALTLFEPQTTLGHDRPLSDGQAERLLQDARAAAASGDLAEADRALRQAWTAPRTRSRAASELRSLHDRTSHGPETNEAEIEALLDDLGPGFRRYNTPHFVLLSDAPASWTRQRASLLERTRHQFFRMADRLEYPVIPPARRLVCVIFNRHGDYRAFAREHDGVDAAWVAGYYTLESNRVVFFNTGNAPDVEQALASLKDSEARLNLAGERVPNHEAARVQRQIRTQREAIQRDAESSAMAKAIHEAVHLLAFNTGLQRPASPYPFWVSEGLATAFETDRPSSAFGPDQPYASRQRAAQDLRQSGRWLPLEELLTLMEVPGNDPELAGVMYAQSYAVFTHLFRFHRAALRAYLEDLASLEGRMLEGSDHVRIFELHFGPVDRLARRLNH